MRYEIQELISRLFLLPMTVLILMLPPSRKRSIYFVVMIKSQENHQIFYLFPSPKRNQSFLQKLNQSSPKRFYNPFLLDNTVSRFYRKRSSYPSTAVSHVSLQKDCSKTFKRYKLNTLLSHLFCIQAITRKVWKINQLGLKKKHCF